MKLIIVLLLFVLISCSLLPPDDSLITFQINNSFQEIDVYMEDNKYYMKNISDEIIISVSYELYNEAYTIRKYIVKGEEIKLGDNNRYAYENILTITNIELY